MKIVTFETNNGSPDTEAWLTWRRAGIGGSDAVLIAAAHGLIARDMIPSWVRSLEWLRSDKLGEAEPIEENWAMTRGKQGESRARDLYEEQTGIFVAPIFGEDEEHTFIRSSFDGMSMCGDVVTEIKIPGDDTHTIAALGDVPVYYEPQLAHQGLTAWGHPDLWDSSKELHYVSLLSKSQDLAIVPRKAKHYAILAEKLFKLEAEFWRKLQAGEPIFGSEYANLAALYRQALVLEAEAKKAKEAARAELEAYLKAQGKEKHQGEGLILSYDPKKGNVDYGAFLEAKGIDESELEAYRKEGSKPFVIRVEKPAAKKPASKKAKAGDPPEEQLANAA